VRSRAVVASFGSRAPAPVRVLVLVVDQLTVQRDALRYRGDENDDRLARAQFLDAPRGASGNVTGSARFVGLTAYASGLKSMLDCARGSLLASRTCRQAAGQRTRRARCAPETEPSAASGSSTGTPGRPWNRPQHRSTRAEAWARGSLWRGAGRAAPARPRTAALGRS